MARAPAELYQPSPRSEHVSVYIGGKVIVVGGKIADKKGDNKYIPASHVEVFTGLWESIQPVGTPPTLAVDSAATTIGSTAYQFGGYKLRQYNDEPILSKSLHSLSAGEWRWAALRIRNPEQGPKPKCSCAMVAHGEDRLVVVGGMTMDGCTNEVHCFSVRRGECSQ